MEPPSPGHLDPTGQLFNFKLSDEERRRLTECFEAGTMKNEDEISWKATQEIFHKLTLPIEDSECKRLLTCELPEFLDVVKWRRFEQIVEATFVALDKNGDGVIDQADLTTTLPRVCPSYRRETLDVSQSGMQGMIEAAASDGERITFGDFRKMMLKASGMEERAFHATPEETRVEGRAVYRGELKRTGHHVTESPWWDSQKYVPQVDDQGEHTLRPTAKTKVKSVKTIVNLVMRQLVATPPPSQRRRRRRMLASGKLKGETSDEVFGIVKEKVKPRAPDPPVKRLGGIKPFKPEGRTYRNVIEDFIYRSEDVLDLELDQILHQARSAGMDEEDVSLLASIKAKPKVEKRKPKSLITKKELRMVDGVSLMRLPKQSQEVAQASTSTKAESTKPILKSKKTKEERPAVPKAAVSLAVPGHAKPGTSRGTQARTAAGKKPQLEVPALPRKACSTKSASSGRDAAKAAQPSTAEIPSVSSKANSEARQAASAKIAKAKSETTLSAKSAACTKQSSVKRTVSFPSRTPPRLTVQSPGEGSTGRSAASPRTPANKKRAANAAPASSEGSNKSPGGHLSENSQRGSPREAKSGQKSQNLAAVETGSQTTKTGTQAQASSLLVRAGQRGGPKYIKKKKKEVRFTGVPPHIANYPPWIELCALVKEWKTALRNVRRYWKWAEVLTEIKPPLAYYPEQFAEEPEWKKDAKLLGDVTKEIPNISRTLPDGTEQAPLIDRQIKSFTFLLREHPEMRHVLSRPWRNEWIIRKSDEASSLASTTLPDDYQDSAHPQGLASDTESITDAQSLWMKGWKNRGGECWQGAT